MITIRIVPANRLIITNGEIMSQNASSAEEKKFDPHWKCDTCGNTFQASTAPKTCPSCKQTCTFKDVSCYTPECGGPGKIDPKLL